MTAYYIYRHVTDTTLYEVYTHAQASPQLERAGIVHASSLDLAVALYTRTQFGGGTKAKVSTDIIQISANRSTFRVKSVGSRTHSDGGSTQEPKTIVVRANPKTKRRGKT